VLDEEARDDLVDLLLAVTRKDVGAAVDLILRIGRQVGSIDQQLLRVDIRDFVETYYEVPLEQLKVGNMLHDFVRILSRHQVRCPADLMLLIRALVTLEGVGRALDPQFSMPEHLTPFIEQLVRQRYSLSNMTGRVVDEMRTLFRLAHDVPEQISRTLDRLSRDDFKVQLEHRGLDHLITELDRSGNRIVISLVMASLIVASALIVHSGRASLWASMPIYLLSSLLGIWLIYGVFRSGRL
jgi:ubiquinone biosynthesis protein